jgi:hypothetical protein
MRERLYHFRGFEVKLKPLHALRPAYDGSTGSHFSCYVMLMKSTPPEFAFSFVVENDVSGELEDEQGAVLGGCRAAELYINTYYNRVSGAADLPKSGIVAA